MKQLVNPIQILIMATLLGVCMTDAQTPAVEGGSLLRDGTGLYPRVIRLEHQPNSSDNGRVLAAVVVPPGESDLGVPIFESQDAGKTFSSQPVGSIFDEQMIAGLCCIALFELPQKTGDLEAGTLLWSGSLGQNAIGERRMGLPVYASTDLGRTWTRRSSCSDAPNDGGLWEPEFVVAADGSLTCHFSDETESADHSQFLAMVVSKDGGKTWEPKIKTVAPDQQRLRPGMTTVRRLPSGKYIMTYEVCGYTQAPCAVFVRPSPDGLNWGDPSSLGTRIFSNDGAYPTHTPVLSWTAGPGKEGRLILSMQMYHDRLGLEHPRMGQVLLVNPTGGDGPWLEMASPIKLSGIYDNYCPNYSSPVLPALDGSSVLLIATNYDGTACKPYFGSGRLSTTYSVPDTAKGSGNGQLVYSGRWGQTEVGSKSIAEHISKDTSSSVSLRFYGSSASLLASLAPNRGIAQISLDGGRAVRVDLYSSLQKTGQPVYTSSKLEFGWHTLRLRPSGQKNPASRGTNVGLSGFEFE